MNLKPFSENLLLFEPEQELTQEELKEKLQDPHYLPTREEIFHTFKSLEEWRAFCNDEKHLIFEALNQEYLDALSDYFLQRAKDFGATENKPLIILEVGAGDGRLTYFLQQKIKEQELNKIKIIATNLNSKQWQIAPVFSVENINQKNALQKYQPKIVICSWMPPGKDWTKDFRAVDSVKEYILIGETDSNCCGHRWLTWGNALYSKKNPLYKDEGFERIDLKEISKKQICKTDMWKLEEDGYNFTHSHTVSFRRK